MSAFGAFDPAEVFQAFAMQRVTDDSFDADVVQAPGTDLRCVFLWGHECYNYGVFKQSALHYREALTALNLTWFEADVYNDRALSRRFSLHGVPAFYLYRNGKRLGRITGWPGLPAFQQAIQKLHADAAGQNPAGVS